MGKNANKQSALKLIFLSLMSALSITGVLLMYFILISSTRLSFFIYSLIAGIIILSFFGIRVLTASPTKASVFTIILLLGGVITCLTWTTSLPGIQITTLEVHPEACREYQPTGSPFAFAFVPPPDLWCVTEIDFWPFLLDHIIWTIPLAAVAYFVNKKRLSKAN